jgi:hypothetical protein
VCFFDQDRPDPGLVQRKGREVGVNLKLLGFF